MAPAKTLYVREHDLELWQRAEQVAKRTRQSVSTLVATALEKHLEQLESEAPGARVAHEQQNAGPR